MRRQAALWGVAIVGAVVLAVPGVVLYAYDAGVATYWLNGILILPLVGICLYGLHLWLPVRVQWVLAVLIAPLGGIAYLIWPNDQWWNYGTLTVLPLIALAVRREGRVKKERGEDQVTAGGWGDGPWGPP
jgi:hypothetical protein